MKAPLEVADGVKFDFNKHSHAVLLDKEHARWTTLTINHIKWKYVDTIDHGVNKATILIFGKLPKKIWPDFHKTGLDQAIELFRMEGRDVQFEQTFLTCSHFSKSFYHHVSGEEVCGMQTAILHSQGNLLIRKEVNYIQRYISDNRKSKYGKNTSKNFFWTFFNSFSAAERMETPISSMTKQQVPESIYRYFFYCWMVCVIVTCFIGRHESHHDKNFASIYLPSRWHSYEE